MTTRRVPSLLLAIAASLLVVLTGGGLFFLEAASRWAVDLPPEQQVAVLDGGGSLAGISDDSITAAGRSCVDVAFSIYGLAQPTGERNRIIGMCREMVEGIVSQNPSFSYGWAVTAALASEMHDTAGLLRGLLWSQRTGVNEGAVAAARVVLASRNLDKLDAEVRSGYDRDLGLLVQTNKWISLVARIYSSTEGERARIATIVEGLPQRDQQRFVSAVRSLARSSSS